MTHNEPDTTHSTEKADSSRDISIVTSDHLALQQFKMISFLMGLFIGIYIQFSCLGTTFLVELMIPSSNTMGEYQYRWWYSWVCCMVSSTIGVLVLLSIQSLIRSTTKDYHQWKRTNTNGRVQLLEGCFVAGALLGLSLAWLITNVLITSANAIADHPITSQTVPLHKLQQQTLCWHVLWTFCITLGWYIFLSTYISSASVMAVHDENENENAAATSTNNDVTEPLLTKPMTSANNTVYQSHMGEIRNSSLILGFLIGLFMQCSTLGCNFVLRHMHDHSSYQSPTEDSTPIYDHWFPNSVLTSVLTSSMGIAVLFLVRVVIILFFPSSTSLSISRFYEDVLATVECYYATGAVFGLNVAWMVTDFLTGNSMHFGSGVATLVGTVLWCKFVIYCCGNYRQKIQHAREKEIGNDNV